MNFYDSAPVWEERNQLPNTCRTAKPVVAGEVTNKRVLLVREAQYRNATLNGHFLLDDREGELPNSGWHKVKVYCCWFGHRLKTGPITITVNGAAAKVIPNYSGGVVSDIVR